MLEGGLKLPQSFLAYSLSLASRKEPQQHTHSHGEPPTEAAKAATTLSLVLWFDLWFWLLPDSCQAAATPFSWLAHLFQMFHLPLGTCSHSVWMHVWVFEPFLACIAAHTPHKCLWHILHMRFATHKASSGSLAGARKGWVEGMRFLSQCQWIFIKLLMWK